MRELGEATRNAPQGGQHQPGCAGRQLQSRPPHFWQLRAILHRISLCLPRHHAWKTLPLHELVRADSRRRRKVTEGELPVCAADRKVKDAAAKGADACMLQARDRHAAQPAAANATLRTARQASHCASSEFGCSAHLLSAAEVADWAEHGNRVLLQRAGGHRKQVAALLWNL